MGFESGEELARLRAHEDHVCDASFSPDGRRIVTASVDKTARIWDVSRAEVIVRERAIVLTAALARGIGWRTDAERTDLLMQDAPEDLHAEAKRQLSIRRTIRPRRSPGASSSWSRPSSICAHRCTRAATSRTPSSPRSSACRHPRAPP